MFDNYYRKDISWGGQLLTLETGKIARQADGAVVARLGDTIVLCTVVGARNVKPGQDFFPLTVNYQEKAFAAGKKRRRTEDGDGPMGPTRMVLGKPVIAAVNGPATGGGLAPL